MRLSAEGGVEGAELDVGEGDGGVGELGLDLFGNTRVGRARATLVTGARAVSWVGGVEPEHVCVVVIPDGHDEDHTLGHTGGHGLESTVVFPAVLGLVKDVLGGITEFLVDGVASDTFDLGLRVGDDGAVLDVEALDLGESAGVITSVGDELSDNSEGLAGVNDHALTVELLVAHAVGVEVTSIRVTRTSVALLRVGTTTVSSSAHDLAGLVAGVRSEGGSHGVGFPDIHLSTASTVASDTSVGVVVRRGPVLNVALKTKY